MIKIIRYLIINYNFYYNKKFMKIKTVQLIYYLYLEKEEYINYNIKNNKK